MRRENAISIPIVITFALSALLLACATSHIQPPANAQPNQPATTKSKSEVASGNLPLRVLADVQLSGGTTRFDYQSLDSSSGRLYIAHLGSDLMTVFDVNKQAVIGDVNDIKRVHGVLAEIDPSSDQVVAGYPFTGCKGSHGLLIDSERRLAFAACEDNSKLVVFDLESKTATATLAVGADPDVLAFDAGLRRLYVSAESGIISVFDERDRGLQKVGEGLFAPNAHSVAVDPSTHRVYFPLQNINGKPVLRIAVPSDK